MKELTDQIGRGTDTFVFLQGGGALWRANLHEVASVLNSTDSQSIPSYYSPKDCAAFLRLSNFERLPTDWLNRNAVGLTRGGPTPIANLLASQGTLFYVQLASEGNIVEVAESNGPLCLIGSGRMTPAQLEEAAKLIDTTGSWSHWWSFAIKPKAVNRLKPPFDLYLNTGGDRLEYRFRVDALTESPDADGMTSPWPNSTLSAFQDKTRVGAKRSEVCRTWIRVGVIERLNPPLSTKNFDPVVGLSTRATLLHQTTFGYAVKNAVDQENRVDLYLDPLLIDQILAAVLGSSPQIVLAGPPGTSKTWVAKAIAKRITDSPSAVRMVQFHPNYTYEAFVEGLKPVAKDGAGIQFELTPGVLIETVRDMEANGHIGPDAPVYVILIDEMNRANLARVFGELMYLFEYRDEKLRLQYSDSFSLPPNLKFIATMNTADRSIRSIDIALRRRFDVFELSPDHEILEKYFATRSCEILNLISGFKKLNEDLKTQLDRHHCIGHAFFMRDGLDRGLLQGLWDRKIFPLIEEYFFDQPDIAGQFSIEKYWPVGASDSH